MSLRKQGLYQQNNDSTAPVNTDLFLDLDDLHFFRVFGLGLRHVELDRGLAEAQHNTGYGDAVSLANFGLRTEWRVRDEVNTQNARVLQDEMSKFIKATLRDYHQPDGKYNKAAFLLVIRGEKARFPRDFQAYALGKCEKAQFNSHQVMAMVKSDELENTDLAHAAQQCFQAAISAALASKIKLAYELKTKLQQTSYAHLIPVLDKLIHYYKKGVVINAPVLSSIFQCAVQAGCYRAHENSRHFDTAGFPYLDAAGIVTAMKLIDEKELKVTGVVNRPDEYNHPLADLCTIEKPDTAAKLKALLPRADAYAKYIAIRRCTLELNYCDACNRPRGDAEIRDRKGAEHYWQLRRLLIASLTESECAEMSVYHQQALSEARPAKSAGLLVNDLMRFERLVEDADKAIIERNLQLCFGAAPDLKNKILLK